MPDRRETLRLLREADLPLLAGVAALFVMGMAMLWRIAPPSEENSYALRQLMWMAAGLAAMAAAWRVDYVTLARLSRLAWGASLLLLVLILLFGRETAGARSWIDFGPFSFQPSEMAKLSALLLGSAYLSDQRRERASFGRNRFLALALIFGLPAALTALQPDLGSALSFVPVFLLFLYLGEADWRWFAAMALLAAMLLPAAWFGLLKDYQKARLMSFLNPGADPKGAGYQVMQAKIAVGAGGWAGRSMDIPTQSQLRFVPAQHTDFIFAVHAESWGLMGVAAAMGAYLLVLFRLLRIAETAKDSLGFFLCSGIFALVLAQAMLGMGMAIGFFPVTGLPLPWMSYGGSALAAFMAAAGLALNVRARRFVN
jgi:rod shape determining protein RodA